MYVCVMSLESVCSQGMILSCHGPVFRALISNISTLLTKKDHLSSKSKFSATISFILFQVTDQVKVGFVPDGVSFEYFESLLRVQKV